MTVHFSRALQCSRWDQESWLPLTIVPECPFCRIVAGDDEASVVYETDECMAFLPFSPATRGHTLVVPKSHVEDVWDIHPDLAAAVIRMCVRVAGAIRAAFGPMGVNLINSTGEVATQSVPHFHFHVVPRWANDGLALDWPPIRQWSEVDLRNVARRIAAELTRD